MQHPQLLIVTRDRVNALGLQALLAHEKRLKVSALTARAEDEMGALLAEQHPDLILLDCSKLTAPVCSRLVELALGRLTGGELLVLYSPERPAVGQAALAAGASGVYAKTGPMHDLVKALFLVARGDNYTDIAVAVKMLPPRQLAILQLLSQGASTDEIATELQVKHDTVKSHVKGFLSSLNARTRAHAIASSIRQGII